MTLKRANEEEKAHEAGENVTPAAAPPQSGDRTPVSFLDDDWSWSSPSTWPLSVRFLPFPVACIALFLGVYVQHFMDSAPAQGTPRNCMKQFDFGIPVSRIEKLATSLATHDWEQGAAAEALLELHNPELAVFGQDPFPDGKIPELGGTRAPIPALRYVLPKIQLGQIALSNNTWGVADPASLGVFAMLAATGGASLVSTDRERLAYRKAADTQAMYLLTEAPRYGSTGAISHRLDPPELWSDAIFMFPPFLAYHSVEMNRNMLNLMSVRHVPKQISLYREALIIPSGPSKGAWRHIVGPSDMADPEPWSTGNGWAAYGILRVRATLSAWKAGAHLLRPEIKSLDTWTVEILDAVIRTDDHPSGLLRNYLGDESWFGEAAGTALLAAAAYRFAGFLEEGDEDRARYVEWAGRKREAVWRHIDAEGVVAPAVNSLKHGQRQPMDGVNPEAESFVLLLAAAWRDCVCSDVCED